MTLAAYTPIPTYTQQPTIAIEVTRLVIVTATPEGPFTLDGQVFDQTKDYFFKIEPIESMGKLNYLWGFFQNGQLVWENWRDESILSSNEYLIPLGSTAHSKLKTGPLEIWIRAYKSTGEDAGYLIMLFVEIR